MHKWNNGKHIIQYSKKSYCLQLKYFFNYIIKDISEVDINLMRNLNQNFYFVFYPCINI